MGCLASLILGWGFLADPPEAVDPLLLPRDLAQDPRASAFGRFDAQDDGPPGPRRLEPYRRPLDSEDPEAWSLRMSLEVRSLRGSTHVRENDSQPALLSLGEDLGFGPAPGLRFKIQRETDSLCFFLDVEMVHGTGRSTLPQDFAYDEGNFAGGLPFTVSVDLFFARAGAAFKDLGIPVDGGWIAPFIALEYPRISLSIRQPAIGASTGEQYKQCMPYPIAGLVARIALDEQLTLEGRATLGYLPEIPTPFAEGGRLYFSVRTAAAEAELRWRLTKGFSISVGGGMSTWSGVLRSREDGNHLSLISPQATLGLEFRF